MPILSRWWYPALQFCSSITLLSRGWLTWRWDSPIRELLWQEGWWSAWINWEDFAYQSDPWISVTLSTLGICLMIGSIVPWLVGVRGVRWLLWPLVGMLALDAVARWVNADFEFAMAIEHLLQIGVPVCLFLSRNSAKPTKRVAGVLSIAAALTFVGHGLYASGIFDVPLLYQTMTMNILGVSRDHALGFLATAGWMDFVVAVCLFFRPTRTGALLYMILWGGATALARVVAHNTIDPWLAETAVRTSHWLIPLLLFSIWKNQKDPGNILV